MQDVQVLLQTKHIFGARRWHRLPPEQWFHLKLPAHLADQVLRIQVCKTPHVALFECQVAEQFPKDAYGCLAKGAKYLGFSKGIACVLHCRSANAHLIFWDRPKYEEIFHLDLDFANLSDFEAFALNQMRILRPSDWNELIQLLHGQSLSDVFYKTLRRHIDKLAVKRDAAYHGLVDLVLKLLVLVFVQRKGWLNFDPYYLASKMQACADRGLSILQCFLRPLFARLEGAPVKEWLVMGTLPRLGGGLFQFTPEVLPKIPNDWLLELYRDVVSQFSFSLFESRENRHVIGISPEVLGHVFENLLRHPDRKQLGTYFTPMKLALKQVDEGLGHYLGQEILDSSKHKATLEDLKVLDPSCGSGTYLVAAFQVLLRHHLAIAPKNERYNGKLFELKKRIVTRNLFGVDIHPMAIRLTEVRLWLNMIQDLEVKTPAEAPPLPSLQHHLRSGDFLGQYRPARFDKAKTWPEYGRLLKLRTRFPHASAGRRQVLLRHIHRLETELFNFLSTTKELKQWREYQESLGQMRLPGQVFPKQTAGERPKTETQPSQVHIMFCEALLSGGFDLIIGNPPWLSATKMVPGHRERILEHLTMPEGLRLRGQIDLSIYFLVASLNLLKSGGHLGFLMPGKLLQAKFAVGLRQYLSRRFRLDYLWDMGIDQGQVFQADTFPLAIGLSHVKPPENHQVAIAISGKEISQQFELPQSHLAGKEIPWVLEPKQVSKTPYPCEAWQPLGSLPFQVKRGIVTGAKRIFVFEEPPLFMPKSRIKPLLRGRDIQDEKVAPGAWIYWPFDHGPLSLGDLFPEERRWLEQSSKLKDLGPQFRLPYRNLVLPPWCLVWKYLGKQWQVTLLKSGSWVPDQTTYYLGFENFEMAYRVFVYAHMPGVSAYLARLAERGKDRFMFFYAHTVKALPVPPNLSKLTLEIPPAKAWITPGEGRAVWAGEAGEQLSNLWQSTWQAMGGKDTAWLFNSLSGCAS